MADYRYGSKDINQRTETVKDTVRKTNVQVNGLDEDFRKDYEQSFARNGYSYDQVRPAHDYGRQLAADEHYRDRDWPTIETEARQAFEKRNTGQWTTSGPAIRHGYDRALLRARGR